MKVLLLGIGRQGEAALHDLLQSGDVSRVIVGDVDRAALEMHAGPRRHDERVSCETIDAGDPAALERLLARSIDVVVDLLPVRFHAAVARAAIRNGVHFVDASYVTSEIEELDGAARAASLTILPEFGMDPGIDLVLLGEAVRSLDTVKEIVSYGAGFPAPGAARNPIRYKATWTLEGVLRSYYRPSRVIRNGRTIEIGATETFDPGHIHEVEIEGLGRLEAFPNGDANAVVRTLGLDTARLERVERCVLRWPGHSAFWKSLVDLHLLDDEPVEVDCVAIDRKRFLAAVLEPHLVYNDDEDDLVVVRVEVKGTRDGRPERALCQVIDRRDRKTGHTAMSRTVGYTASIGAFMIGSGRISEHGVLSPLRDIPFDVFVDELAKRGINVTCDLPGRDDR